MYVPLKYWEGLIKGDLRFVVLAITGQCKYKCPMCAYNSNRSNRRISIGNIERSMKDVRTFLREHKDKRIAISLTGGEPLEEIKSGLLTEVGMWVNILKKEFGEDRILSTICTSGYPLEDDDKIKELKRMCDVGYFDFIQLSISEDHHKQGNEKWVRKALEALPCYVNVVGMPFAFANELYNNALANVPEDMRNICPLRNIRNKKEDWVESKKGMVCIGCMPFGLFVGIDGKVKSCCANEGQEGQCEFESVKEGLEKIFAHGMCQIITDEIVEPFDEYHETSGCQLCRQYLPDFKCYEWQMVSIMGGKCQPVGHGENIKKF